MLISKQRGGGHSVTSPISYHSVNIRALHIRIKIADSTTDNNMSWLPYTTKINKESRKNENKLKILS